MLKPQAVSGVTNGYSVYQSGADDLNYFAGNVSIGTTNPMGYKLAVNGGIIATSMKVKLYSGWPDYVFKKGYQLPSLNEVEKYIDRYQRLPDLPSEQQIYKDGLNLEEMNKLLIKKVEELTLYLIELQKQNDEIKNDLRKLKAGINYK